MSGSLNQISALLDGELDEVEAARLIARLKSDAELRFAWDEYHRVGDALRGHMARDICARVSVRLAEEPTVLVARARPASVHRIGRQALYAAASLAAIALVVWVAMPGLVTSPQLAQQTPPPPAVVQEGPATTSPGPAARAEAALSALGVGNYLLAHQRYSPANAMQGVAPYARTVSGEEDER